MKYEVRSNTYLVCAGSKKEVSIFQLLSCFFVQNNSREKICNRIIYNCCAYSRVIISINSNLYYVLSLFCFPPMISCCRDRYELYGEERRENPTIYLVTYYVHSLVLFQKFVYNMYTLCSTNCIYDTPHDWFSISEEGRSLILLPESSNVLMLLLSFAC